MIMLKLDLKLYIKQNLEKGLKYQLLNKCVKSLPIALAQVKARNDSENLLNQIRKIVYSLYQSQEIVKKYTIT